MTNKTPDYPFSVYQFLDPSTGARSPEFTTHEISELIKLLKDHEVPLEHYVLAICDFDASGTLSFSRNPVVTVATLLGFDLHTTTTDQPAEVTSNV